MDIRTIGQMERASITNNIANLTIVGAKVLTGVQDPNSAYPNYIHLIDGSGQFIVIGGQREFTPSVQFPSGMGMPVALGQTVTLAIVCNGGAQMGAAINTYYTIP